MKKASSVFLLITAAFLCIMTGTLIGRHTAGNYYSVEAGAASESVTQPADADTYGKLNINTASLSQLSDLPGIGPTLAQRIIDYRTEHGDFQSTDDLLLVEGIGEKRLDAIQELITTGG